MPTDQRVNEGLQLFKQKKYEQAIRVFQECLDFYVSEKDDLAAAEMRNNLSVAYLQNGQAQLAYDSASGTDQVFAAAGEIRKQAMAISNTATALEALHRPQEALELYESALVILNEINDRELRPDILRRVSVLQLKSGRGLEAMSSMETSLKDQNTSRSRFLSKFMNSVRKYFLGY
jgi:tetratricopeptide (TPR) repeat protein